MSRTRSERWLKWLGVQLTALGAKWPAESARELLLLAFASFFHRDRCPRFGSTIITECRHQAKLLFINPPNFIFHFSSTPQLNSYCSLFTSTQELSQTPPTSHNMTSTTSAPRIPPSYLANTALVLSTFITVNNTDALFRPRKGLKQLGFSAPMSPTDQTLVDGLMRMFASTRIVVGVSTMAMWWYRDYRAMGWSMLAGLLMSGVDG